MAGSAMTKIEAMRARLRSVNENRKEQIQDVVDLGVGVVTGAAMGAADQYWGTEAIMGASVPLVLGLSATGAGLFGVGGEATSTLLKSVGKAALICEGYRRGGVMYNEWAANREAA